MKEQFDGQKVSNVRFDLCNTGEQILTESRFSLIKSKVLSSLPTLSKDAGKLILSLAVIAIHFIVIIITLLLSFLGVTIEVERVDMKSRPDYKGRYRLSDIPVQTIYSRRPNGKRYLKFDEYHSVLIAGEEKISTPSGNFRHNPYKLVYVQQTMEKSIGYKA